MSETYILDLKRRPTIDKDPSAVLDYTFDWSAYLASPVDTISSAPLSVVFSVDTTSGVYISLQSNTATTATVWISGGTVGASALVTCMIKTAGGRTDERVIVLKIRQM